MRKIYLLLSAFVFIAAFTGCKTEGCTDESAWNFDPDATDDDGSCVYIGLTGGSWDVWQACQGTGGNIENGYQINVIVNGSADNITIQNFSQGYTVNGTLDKGNLTIPSQTFFDSFVGTNVTISGTGYWDTNRYVINYNISADNGENYDCTMSCTR